MTVEQKKILSELREEYLTKVKSFNYALNNTVTEPIQKKTLLYKREILVKRVLAIDILTPFTEWS